MSGYVMQVGVSGEPNVWPGLPSSHLFIFFSINTSKKRPHAPLIFS